MSSNEFLISGADFCDDFTFRYRLWRVWDHDKPRCTFVMLNPSTADHNKPDPTVTRCLGFARHWGCGGIMVVNLFALISTDPRLLGKVHDPVGPRNNETILAACRDSSLVVAAWGSVKVPYQSHRPVAVRMFLQEAGHELFALKINADGSPAHPLYQPKERDLVKF